MHEAMINDRLHVAVGLHIAHKADEAALVYEEVLSASPDQPDALHMLGLIESHRGHHEIAVGMLQRASELLADSPTVWGNLGVVLRRADRTAEALVAYEKSLSLDPSQADVCFNYAKSLKAVGQIAKAESAYRNSIQLNPRKSSAWLGLIKIAMDACELVKAGQIADQSLQFCPDSADLLLSAGIVWKRSKEPERALELFARTLVVDPQNVEAMCKIASVEISRMRFDEAKRYLEKASGIDGKNVHFLTTQGVLHNSLGENDEAEKVLRRGTQLHPQNGAIRANLGIALKRLGRLSEALDMMTRAIDLDPQNQESVINLAGVELSLGRLAEAQSHFRQVMKMPGGSKDAHDSLLMAMQYDPQVTSRRILQEHMTWDSLHGVPLFESVTVPGIKGGQRKGKLRIGFVSADLGVHPVGYFTLGMFKHLNRERFETYVYSDRPGRDRIAAEIESHVDQFADVAGLSDQLLTSKIRDDRVDILFDLAGHTAQNRLQVFARRAAPFQVTWAGYVGTTGLSQMDFLLGDSYHLPDGCELGYVERLLRMPNGYVTYSPPESPDVGRLPALKNGYLTFAAMCNPAKVNDQVLDVWKRVMSRCENSRLTLAYTGWDDPANRARIVDRLSPEICEQRVRFVAFDTTLDLMQEYQHVDLALDTFPYSGGLTTCEALWMGVPTVTVPDDRFASRHSYSHLANVGLSRFVAEEKDSYEETASQFATDFDGLAEIRASLRSSMAASPLCDHRRFAQDFAEVLHRIAERE